MKHLRAYKTELDPNDRQRSALLAHAGCARWAYNWGLRRKIESYEETGKSPSAIDLHRELNRLKDTPQEDGGVPWMRESSKCAPQEALRDLDKAFANFFRRCREGAKRKGFPRFKSRKRGIGGFRLTGAIRATDTHIKLPRIGWLRLKEHGYLPGDARVLSASVSEQAGRWFVSLLTKQEHPVLAVLPKHVVGVDVGIKALAVTSDGDVFENPRALRSAEKRLRRAQKTVSRRVNGSKNRRKAVARVARLHYRIGNVRKDALHKASSAIVKSASVVVLESLNVAGMLKNRHLSKALSDVSVGELHRQIKYKAARRGVVVVEANRFYPSSKTCSACGNVKQDLTLADRTYRCSACGLVMDRDLNAAMNLKSLAGSSPVTACGEASAGSDTVVRVKLGSVKQEPNSGQGVSLFGSV